MLSRPSNERNSAGLNLTELHRGHSCLVQIRWGNEFNQFQFAALIFFPSFASLSTRFVCTGVRFQPRE